MRKTLSSILSLLLALAGPAPAFAVQKGVPPAAAPIPALGAAVVPPAVPVVSPLTPPVETLPGVSAPVAAAQALEAAKAELAATPEPERLSPEQAQGFAASLLGETPIRAAAAVPEVPAGSGAPALPAASGGDLAPPAPPAPPSASGPARRPFFVRHPRLLRALVSPVKLVYRLKVSGRRNLPEGPALIVSNHVSWFDALYYIAAAGRPLRFVMHRPIYETKGLTWLFRAAGAIPVASGDPKERTQAALAEARDALKDGQSVIIFPEGALTRNGSLLGFRKGFEVVAEGSGAPVIPAHLDGLWGSLLSRREGVTLWSALRGGRRSVEVRFGPALERVEAGLARDAVQGLGADALDARVRESAQPLPRAFLASAKRFWGRRAVADSTGKDLSYGRTLTGSVLLAGLLKERIGTARHVAVLLPPSAGGALANLALGQLGRVAVNLNYTAGKDAVEHAVRKAGIATVVTSRKFVEALKEKKAALPPGEMLFLEDLLPLVPGWKRVATLLALKLLPTRLVAALYFRDAPRSLDDDATVLFTSGSSALPKGVRLTHASISANIEMVRSAFDLTAKDLVLGVLPFFHSFGYTVTLWLPLLSGLGAAYHTHPLETDAIAKLAAKHPPTMLLGTPTFLQRYVAKIPKEAFARVRLAVAGAEKLRGSIADEFEAKFGTRPLEGYGATELSPVAAVNLPDRPKQAGTKPGSVGQPLAGTVMRVVDEDALDKTLAPLPYGRRGMLLVRGPHVMKGYLDDPKKTAEALLPGGWYLTGDIAVMDREGFVTLVDRQSRFSKIAGEMVSHSAVEEKLQAAAGLAEQAFVVAGVPDERRGERLVVLYTAAYAGGVPELIAKAQALGLPGLWTPAPGSFHLVEAIPVLGTGKLDLKAVKELALKLEAGRAKPPAQ